MKEQIKLLIEQHRLHKQEAEIESTSKSYANYQKRELYKEVEMRTLFISELEELLEQC
jgi:hypothetical protein